MSAPCEDAGAVQGNAEAPRSTAQHPGRLSAATSYTQDASKITGHYTQGQLLLNGLNMDARFTAAEGMHTRIRRTCFSWLLLSTHKLFCCDSASCKGRGPV